jgi:hypothetical protein
MWNWPKWTEKGKHNEKEHIFTFLESVCVFLMKEEQLILMDYLIRYRLKGGEDRI